MEKLSEVHVMDEWEKFTSLPKKEDFHDLYLKSDKLLLADVFEKFRKICLEIYVLDTATFLPATGLIWKVALKKAKVEIELLTYINMLLMIEKGIRGRICHSIKRYAKTSNKYMEIYDKNKELSYPKYWDVNILYG